MTDEDITLIAFALNDLKKDLKPKQWLLVVNRFVRILDTQCTKSRIKRFLRQASGKPKGKA